jgi:hypothetical protein
MSPITSAATKAELREEKKEHSKDKRELRHPMGPYALRFDIRWQLSFSPKAPSRHRLGRGQLGYFVLNYPAMN